MLATLVIWFDIFLLTLVFGFTFVSRFKPARPVNLSLPVLLLVGLALLTTLSTLFSLVIPIGLAANLVLALAGLGLAGWQRQALAAFLKLKWQALRRLHPAALLLCAAVCGVVLAKGVQTPLNYDTGLYHAQAIRWIESYPAVPGLGVLQDRLAFDSTWTVAGALFSFSFLGLQSFHVLGAFLAVLLAAYFTARIDRLFQRELTLSGCAALLGIFLLRRIFPLEFSSPGTDLPAALLVWLIFFVSLEKIEKRTVKTFDGEALAIVTLSLYVLTIKLSVLPVVLLPLYFWAAQNKRDRLHSLAVLAGLALLILAPWMGRNVILSGYLVYPLPQVDLFHPDWKIPLAQARDTFDNIRAWARSASNDTAVLAAPLTAWLPAWYRMQDPADIQLLWAAGGELVLWLGAAAWLLVRRKKAPAGWLRYAMLYLAALVGLAYWFIQAPAIRFGYGFIGIWLCLLLAPFILLSLERFARWGKWVSLALVAGLILYQGVSLFSLARSPQAGATWLLPADYPQAPVAAQTIGGLTLYTPTHGDQCWYAAFPCVPNLGPGTGLRGAAFASGFKASSR